MKRELLILAALLFLLPNITKAQYTTPNTGVNYTLNDLVNVSDGAVVFSDGVYKINSSITISPNDEFSILENAILECASNAKITINGKATIMPPDEVLFISSDTVNSANSFINLYFSDGQSGSVVENANFRFMCGLKAFNTANLTVRNCTFYKNVYKSAHGAGAITFSNSNIVIKKCKFIKNERSAITSPANGSAVPTIDSCYFYKNSTANKNYPQINLGPGSATDTTRITNNYVEGFYSMSGGIAVSNLMAGSNLALIKNNYVTNNRYGIAGVGNNIKMYVINNKLIDNNLEVNPMNGGSGINLYSSQPNSYVFASENYIAGSLWGVTLVGSAKGNFGNLNNEDGEYNVGHNVFRNNGNGGVTYHLYNNTANDLKAQNNDWDAQTVEQAEGYIFHHTDDSQLGTVEFAPIWHQVECVSGIKNIPGDYNNINEAVEQLNQLGVCEGGVIFKLSASSVHNAQPILITASGTSNSPIVFTSNDSVNIATLKFSSTLNEQSAILLNNGNDYISFSNLKIDANNASFINGIAIKSNDSLNGSQHVDIKNCEIIMSSSSIQTNGICSYCKPFSEMGSNSYNKFIDNKISNSFIAINIVNEQTNSNYFDIDNEVFATEKGKSKLTDLKLCGIYTKGQKGLKIYKNIIENIEHNGTNALAGISCNDNNPSDDMFNFTYKIHDNTIKAIKSETKSVYGIYFSARKTNAQVFNNVISDIKTTSGDNSTANGILLMATSTKADVFNNMVSDIAAPANSVSNAPATRGITIGNCDTINLYYNSVALKYEATNVAHQSAALFVHGNTTHYLLQNNIFSNSVILPESSTGRSVAYYKRNNVLTYIQSASNNNLYYAGEPTDKNLIFYAYNASAPIVATTIEVFKEKMSAISNVTEQNSISVKPAFLNEISDLHINNENQTEINGSALPINKINYDIDYQQRNVTNPDIGADEFDVQIEYPKILVNPTSFDITLNVGESDTSNIKISNLGEGLLTYKIFVNGHSEPAQNDYLLLSNYQGSVESNSFIDISMIINSLMELEPGIYNSVIKIVSNDTANLEVNIPVTVNVIANICEAPTNLTAKFVNNDIHKIELKWDGPNITGSENGNWISWHKEANPNGFGPNQIADFSVVNRYDINDLAPYNNKYLTKIKFLPRLKNANFSIRVWTGGSQAAPGELIVDKAVNSIIENEWNEVVLDNPVKISASKELWFGYRCNQTSVGFTIGIDKGPSVNYKGNMMYTMNMWLPALNMGLDINWLIAGFVAESEKENAVAEIMTNADNKTSNHVLGYNIYKNDSLLVEKHKSKSIELNTNVTDIAKFWVTTVCTNGESDTSNHATLYVNVDEIEAKVGVYPNPANNKINISCPVEIKNIKVINVLGQVFKSIDVKNERNIVVDVSKYNEGVYTIIFSTIKGVMFGKKVIIVRQ